MNLIKLINKNIILGILLFGCFSQASKLPQASDPSILKFTNNPEKSNVAFSTTGGLTVSAPVFYSSSAAALDLPILEDCCGKHATTGPTLFGAFENPFYNTAGSIENAPPPESEGK